jgi:integrase/recombinase XerD
MEHTPCEDGKSDLPASMTPKYIRHLPRDLWPATDLARFDAMFARGDIFDDHCPPGSHLSDGTRRHIETAYKRWLGYLVSFEPACLDLDPINRITVDRLRGFIGHLRNHVRDTTTASVLDGLHYAARLMAPDHDWSWLGSLQKRIKAGSTPIDRLDHLQPPWDTLDLGLAMMEKARGEIEARAADPDPHFLEQVNYRDGLVLCLLSLWPIRRRSIAALTVNRHVARLGDQIHLKLHEEDTKARRSETFLVPECLKPHVLYYLNSVRPALMRFLPHDAFWVSQRGTPLTADAIYQIVRRHTREAFGTPMGLHDFRRAAGTFLALHAPEMIGILPGVLQHSGPDTSDRHYKFAGSITASRRYRDALADLKDPRSNKPTKRGR